MQKSSPGTGAVPQTCKTRVRAAVHGAVVPAGRPPKWASGLRSAPIGETSMLWSTREATFRGRQTITIEGDKH